MMGISLGLIMAKGGSWRYVKTIKGLGMFGEWNVLVFFYAADACV
jgi:hypothetical protein